MKPRRPNTLEHALIQAAFFLEGVDGIVAVTGRSATTFRAWADPDRDDCVPLALAVKIDRACKAACGETPIRDFYDRQVCDVDAPAETMPVQSRLLELHIALGKLSEMLSAAPAPKPANGPQVTPNEAAQIAGQIASAREQLNKIEQAVAQEVGR